MITNHEDDDFKKMFDLEIDPQRSEQDSGQAAKQIIAKAKSQQSQKDLLSFGFVKLWTVVLEFLSIFYVYSQNRKGVRYESRNY